MRNFLKWTSLAVLITLFSCAKVDYTGEIPDFTEPGVYGYIEPAVEEDALATKANVTSDKMSYVFEQGDRVNIWSESGTLLIYYVSSVNDSGHATFDGDGFKLADGKTYYSSVPVIRNVMESYHELSFSYEGQVQAANNDARHTAPYTFTYSSATCNNGSTSFVYNRLNSYFRLIITLPEALTLTELSIIADDANFFTLNGTADISTGVFTPGDKTNTMTLGLNNIAVSDVLYAFLAVSPLDAGEFIIRVTDSEGRVYTSPKISKPALTQGNIRRVETEVFLGETPAVAKIGNTQFETLEAAFAAAVDGDTITLLSDCAGNGIIAPQGKFNTDGLTVDFNGFTYTVDGNLVGSSGTETQAFQLLKDNKITFKGGTVYSEKALFLVQNYSNLTLKDMTLTLNNANYQYGYTLSNNNGTIVIDSSIINANPAGAFAFDVCRNSSYLSVDVTVKGTSVINGDIEVSAAGNDPKDGLALTVEAGTFNGNLVLDPSGAAVIENNPAKAVIKKNNGVTLDAPSGFIWNNNGDGTSTLVVAPKVAQIGDTKYGTLEEAFAAAEDGNTITLLADCEGNGIIAPQGKFATNGLTVDFAGHTYDFSGSGVGSTGTEYNGFQLLMGNTITFTNGTLTASSEDAGFLIQNYSNLTLDNMTVDGSDIWGGYVISNNNGNVVINDTEIIAPTGDFAFDVCRYASYPSVNVTVKGSSVINGNVEVSASGSDPKDGFSLMLETALNGDIVIDPTAAAAMASAPNKASVSKKDGVNQEAPEGFDWVDNGDGTSSLKAFVAKIGDVFYASLPAAIAAASSGATITMIADEQVEVTGYAITIPSGKSIVLDLNGKTVTGPCSSGGTSALILNLGNLTITDSASGGFLVAGADNTWTWDGSDDYTGSYASNLIRNEGTLIVNGGTLYNASTGSAVYAIDNYSAGKVTINGGTVDAKKAAAIRMFYNNGGSVTVNGGTIGHYNNDNDCSYMGIQVMAGTNADVFISGGTLAGMYALYSNGSGDSSVDITGGSFDGVVGFAASLVNISISDGTFYDWAGTWGSQTAFITGGSFADDPTEYLAPGYKAELDGDMYVVVPCVYVSEVNGVQYETLEEAFAAAQDGQTITLLDDCVGNGIKAPEGKFASQGLTIDFNGHSYDFSGTGVGSTNTEYNGFQLLQNNTITFLNGTLTASSEDAGYLIQNYSNLTLKNMTVDGTDVWGGYTISNNCGNVVIDGSTIKAPSGGVAFDVCRYASYPSVSVTVTGSSVINGKIEVDASGGDPKDGLSLTLSSCSVSGSLNLTSGGASALTAHPDKAVVTKSDAIQLAAPSGFSWVSNGTTSTLVVN